MIHTLMQHMALLGVLILEPVEHVPFWLRKRDMHGVTVYHTTGYVPTRGFSTLPWQ